MRNFSLMRPLASFMLVCFLAQAILPAAAFAAGEIRTVQFGLGRSTIIAFDGVVKRVSLGNPSVADFNVVSKSEVMVLGLKAGRTELYVWPEEGALITYDLAIVDDLADYREKLGRVIGRDSAARVTAVLAGSTGKETIVLRGAVTSQSDSDAAQDLAELYNYKCMNLLEVRDTQTAAVRQGAEGGFGSPEGDRTSCIFTLRHAQATDIKLVLDKIKSTDGTLEIDPRTNSLIVIDRPPVVQRITSILNVLDQPEPQVMIEAKIIEVALGDDMKSAFNWIYETLYNGTNAIGGAMNNKVLSVKDGAITGTFDYGKISNDHFTAQILPALSLRKSRLVSSPTAVTLNKKEAIINILDTVPTAGDSTKDSFGQTTVAKADMKVGVTLKVTPTVVDRDNITLNLYIKEDNLVEKVEYATGQFGYRTSNRESTNIVNVAANETLVIGGLIKDESLNTNSKVPLLGNIPYLKNAFKQFTKALTRREILIFVTTRIVNDGRMAKVDAVKYVNIASEERKYEEEQIKIYERKRRSEGDALPRTLPAEPVRPASGGAMKEIPELTRKFAVHRIDAERADPKSEAKSEPGPEPKSEPKTVAKVAPEANDAAEASKTAAKVEAVPVKEAAKADDRTVAKAAPKKTSLPRDLRTGEAKALLDGIKASLMKTPAARPATVATAAAEEKPAAAPAAAPATSPAIAQAAPQAVKPAIKPAEIVLAPSKVKPAAKAEPATTAKAEAGTPAERPAAKVAPKRVVKKLAVNPAKKSPDPLRSVEARRLLEALKGQEAAPATAPQEEPARAPESAAAPEPAPAKAEATPVAKKAAAADPLDPARIKELAKRSFNVKIAGCDALAKHLGDRMDKNEMKQALQELRLSASAPAGGVR